MKSRSVVYEATLRGKDIVINEDKMIGKPIFEELPNEYRIKDNEEFMKWVGRCSTYIGECNAKTQALKKRLHKNGEKFTITIKYLVE